MLRALALCFLVVACAPSSGPGLTAAATKPSGAIIYPVGLNLLMSDGTLCAGHRPRLARDWTGQLSGCPHPLPYQVQGSDPALPRLELRRGEDGSGPTVSVAGQVFSAP